jgi:hypothetical protein
MFSKGGKRRYQHILAELPANSFLLYFQIYFDITNESIIFFAVDISNRLEGAAEYVRI